MNARPSALTRRFAELGFLFGKLSRTKRAVFNIVQKTLPPPFPLPFEHYVEICLNTQPSLADFPAVFFHISHWYLSWTQLN